MAAIGSPHYLGLISGTSADGVDAALVRFEPRLEVIAARTAPYDESLRQRILGLTAARAAIALDDYGRLDSEIGVHFAATAEALLASAGVDRSRVHAIGSHGQTVRHRPHGALPFTLQIGDPNLIAERTRITTVADFRRADVAAGGQGAPLLPGLHAAIFSDPRTPRAILNLGGIANVTVLIPGEDVLGFDTGPANCLLDAWASRHLGTIRDENGEWGASASADPTLLTTWLQDAYFSAKPPKSSGREYFNLDWLDARLDVDSNAAVVQATLLALSARTIAAALRTQMPAAFEVYACGGGVHNAALMDAIGAALPGVPVQSTSALGLDPDFVEAVGFAWLARARLRGEPGNLPSVTGARGPRQLGAIYAAA